MFILEKKDYKIRKVKKKGRGVFILKEIQAGTLIGDYLGVIMKDSDLDATQSGGVCYAMDYVGEDTSIYPLDIKAPGVHLINHSCAPNCSATFYYGHTIYFALRRIHKGEELTIDYNFDPFDEKNEKYYLYPCFCGSPLCRGTLYDNTDRIKEQTDFSKRMAKGQKYEVLKPGEILPPLKKYPRAISDNEFYDLYADLKAKPLDFSDKKVPPIREIRRRLRESGRPIRFRSLGLTVWGVANGSILSLK